MMNSTDWLQKEKEWNCLTLTAAKNRTQGKKDTSLALAQANYKIVDTNTEKIIAFNM